MPGQPPMLSRMTLFAIVRRAVSLWNTPWARYAALAAIVLVVVQIVRLVVQQFRRPETLDFRSPDRLVDLATLRRPTAETATGLAIHNLPCRLAVVAFAPLGRIQPPRDDEVPAALDRILPGLGAVAEREKPSGPTGSALWAWPWAPPTPIGLGCCDSRKRPTGSGHSRCRPPGRYPREADLRGAADCPTGLATAPGAAMIRL
jgi:hypothetical protein